MDCDPHPQFQDSEDKEEEDLDQDCVPEQVSDHDPGQVDPMAFRR